MKSKKILISLFIAMTLLFVSIVPSFAQTIIIMDGYKYSMTENSTASIVGWDNSSDSLVIPEKIGSVYVTEIDDSAFYQDDFIKSVDFSNAGRLDSIGMYAFAKSIIEGELTIPTCVTSIGISAFEECNNLESVNFSSRGGVVSAQCFKNCVSLKKVLLSDYIQKIDRYSFAGCTALESIVIPKTVTEIRPTAFVDDDNLTIYCYLNSYAQQFADDNNIPYVLIDGPKTGDANGDGMVDILDSTEIQKYAAESTEFTPEQFELGDINKDGYCDVIDALLVQKYVVGVYDIPPIIYNN